MCWILIDLMDYVSTRLVLMPTHDGHTTQKLRAYTLACRKRTDKIEVLLPYLGYLSFGTKSPPGSRSIYPLRTNENDVGRKLRGEVTHQVIIPTQRERPECPRARCGDAPMWAI
jgi:hypothetical protein